MSKLRKAFFMILSTYSDCKLSELLKDSGLSEGAIGCIYEEIENRKRQQDAKEGDCPGSKD